MKTSNAYMSVSRERSELVKRFFRHHVYSSSKSRVTDDFVNHFIDSSLTAHDLTNEDWIIEQIAIFSPVPDYVDSAEYDWRHFVEGQIKGRGQTHKAVKRFVKRLNELAVKV